MHTKLIELQEGVLVEVEVESNNVRAISGGLAEKVSASFDSIRPVLMMVAQSLANTWKVMDSHVDVDKMTVELGLSFAGEGNIYITKVTSGANLTVTLELKPKAPNRESIITS